MNMQKMLRVHISYFLVVFVLLLKVPSAYGQIADIITDRDSILIGEQTTIRISVSCGNESIPNIPFTQIYDSISNNFEILNFGVADTISDKETGIVTIKQNLSITSWEEGIHVIYPFEIQCLQNGETTTMESEARVLSVWLISVDDQLPPKDIKSILNIPLTLREVLPWLIIGLLVLISAFLLWKFRHKFRKKAEGEKAIIKPDVPAHIYALEELEKLKKKRLWQDGKIKMFHVELSGIVRTYLEYRYEVPALEMTSEETLSSLEYLATELPEQYKNLDKVLKLADLVKFAKYEPLPDENQRNLDLAFDFVYHTIEKENEPKPGQEEDLNVMKNRYCCKR